MKNFYFKTLFILTIVLTSCSTEEEDILFESKAEEIIVTYNTIELEVLDLVNTYRASKSLPSLQKMDIISSVAKSHSDYMVETGLVNHDNFPLRNKELINKANASSVGENVAYGFNSAEGVVNAWLKSDAHRSIIEREDFTHFGVSVETNKEGKKYFTHMFIKQ
jgi:uncharacterized protein YkwD